MARLEDAISYQGIQRSVFCSFHSCGGGGGLGSGQSEAPEPPSRQDSAPQTEQLPLTLSMDATIYVAVVVVFYGLLVLLLVGTNMHRFRRRRTPPQREAVATGDEAAGEGSSTSPKHLKVSVTSPPEDSEITLV